MNREDILSRVRARLQVVGPLKDFVELAELVAYHTHKGQKYGEKPYIYHLQGVVDLVQSYEAKQVAWLHDVLEDTELEAQDLLDLGFSTQVVNAVIDITKEKGINRFIYLEIVKQNKLSLEVKLADSYFNMRESFKQGDYRRARYYSDTTNQLLKDI